MTNRIYLEMAVRIKLQGRPCRSGSRSEGGSSLKTRSSNQDGFVKDTRSRRTLTMHDSQGKFGSINRASSGESGVF